MSPDLLESLILGSRETDAVEFKGPMDWNKGALARDILALSNVIDGGYIVIGVEDGTFSPIGLTQAQIDTYDIEIMRDQIAPYADPKVVFHRDIVEGAEGRRFVVITVSPFEELPVICRKGGADVKEGDIYFRSKVRSPASERVSRADDMREILETAIARRSRRLRRIGLMPEEAGVETEKFDRELGGL